MTTLVIQSVFTEALLLVLDETCEVIAQKTWVSDKDEVKKLPPAMEELLVEAGFAWSDIKRIVIVVGIGNFSSTRISVTIANVLAMVTNAELFELELSEELTLEKLNNLVKDKFSDGWEPVKIAKPVYKTEPMITPSKKPKFNT
jgi:tRNA A37 threonylcarbamoyladenosine modification protein TsaB